MESKIRLAYLITHPIQYQAPPAAPACCGARHGPDGVFLQRFFPEKLSVPLLW